MECRYASRYRNSVKTASPRNFTEIGQLATELWLERAFKMADVRHLEFQIFIFGHLAVIKFQMCWYVPNCIKIG